MSKKTAALSLPGSAVIPKFRIYPPMQRIMKVDNSVIPEYTIIRGANMDTDVVYDLWESYFPLVTVTYIGDMSENLSKDSFVAMIKPFIIYRDGIYLLDIKGMAKVQPFKSLFPSETDPAYKYWPKLEKELEKGKPIKIIEFFIGEDEKELISRHEKKKNPLRKRLRKEMPEKADKERREKEFAPIDDDLPERFFNKTTREYNWMYYYITENIFKYDFSDVIENYESNSIYEAFRCEVSRSFVRWYIGKYVDDRIKRAIENIKGKGYYLPTRTEFLDSIVKSMTFEKEDDHLKRLGQDSLVYEDSGGWEHYKNKFYRILLEELNMENEAEELENEETNWDIVKFIFELIDDPKTREKLENIQIRKIVFKKLDKKIKHWVDNSILSLNELVGEDGDELIKLLEDTNNYDTYAKEIDNKGPFRNVSSYLADDELKILREKLCGFFETAFEGDEYAQCGRTNFASNKAFKRFIKWLVPYIDFYDSKDIIKKTKDNDRHQTKPDTEKQESSEESELLLEQLEDLKKQYGEQLLNSDLFKDYCRVHEINGCKKCVMITNGESEEDHPIARSVSGLSYDINKCATCSLMDKNKDTIKNLKQDQGRLRRAIERLFKLIIDDKKKISGEKDEKKY